MSRAAAAPPRFLYGTAWKEDDTERLTLLAIENGFRGIDTANQRRHYHEAGAGRGIAEALRRGLVTRDALYLQTKFTSVDGQDHRLPYDAGADAATQVRQSFESSLAHLGVEVLDSYVLHGPSTRAGLADYDWQVWRAMEALYAEKKTRALGVSNVTLAQLEALCAGAKTPPASVQNRCYARTGWDRQVRAFCRAAGIVYQGFSLLTANRAELAQPEFRRLCERAGGSAAQVVFAFAHAVGILPLTGTSSAAHMQEDLACDTLSLGDDDLALVEDLATRR